MTYDSRACQSFVMALLKTDGALTDDGVLQDHVPQVRRLLEQHGHIPFRCESQFRPRASVDPSDAPFEFGVAPRVTGDAQDSTSWLGALPP